MVSGKWNFVVGAVFMALAGLWAFTLGPNIESFFESGFYHVTLERKFLVGGHTHGMLLGLVNMVIGLSLERLALSHRIKAACAGFGLGGLLIPISLVLRGFTGGSTAFLPLGLVGGLSLVAAAILVIVGGIRMKPVTSK